MYLLPDATCLNTWFPWNDTRLANRIGVGGGKSGLRRVESAYMGILYYPLWEYGWFWFYQCFFLLFLIDVLYSYLVLCFYIGRFYANFYCIARLKIKIYWLIDWLIDWAKVRVTGMPKLSNFCNPPHCSSLTFSDARVASYSWSNAQSKKFLSYSSFEHNWGLHQVHDEFLLSSWL